jgi:hypothetical protein
VTARRQGRHRRFRLAGPAVARALEALGDIDGGPAAVRSLRESTIRSQLAAGRTCYDHLAGRLGVAITDALVRRRALIPREGLFTLSRAGAELISHLGIDVAELRSARRPLVLACSDWTENRPHVAGALGSALCSLFLETGWIRKRRGTRAVAVTEAGAVSLRQYLGIDLE